MANQDRKSTRREDEESGKSAQRGEEGLDEVEEKIDKALEDVDDDEIDERLDEAREDAEGSDPDEVMHELEEGREGHGKSSGQSGSGHESAAKDKAAPKAGSSAKKK